MSGKSDHDARQTVVLVAPGPRRLQVGAVLHLPIALLSLASWMRHKGFDAKRIRILDTQLGGMETGCFADARVVGISAMTGSQIRYGLAAAARTRQENPEAVIVWGGVHPTLLPEQTASHPLVDVVVIGEGEQTFLEVVQAVDHGAKTAGIPGTCVTDGKAGTVFGPPRPFLEMEELPLPAYDLVDIDAYKGIRDQFDYQSSRGCPFRCAFCYNTVFCGRRYRKKSARKVLQELSHLHRTYGVRQFGFVDDEFFIDRKRIDRIFTGIPEIGAFGIVASCRLDVVQRFSAELMANMRSAGVSRMFFGAESGSEATLRSIRKDIVPHDILAGAKWVADNGIRPHLSFMGGFPGERPEDFEKTIDIVLQLWRLHPRIVVNGIFPFNAYPGTELYRKAIEMGFQPPESLDQWGEWTFQYKPDNPWIDDRMKRWIEIAFYMVRFRYYLARFEERCRGKTARIFLETAAWPVKASIELRFRHRWFGMAWEWKLFAFLARKTFGYL